MPKKYTEADINLALWELNLNEFATIINTAETFNIPLQTLRGRLAGRRPQHDYETTPRSLTLLKEEAIVKRVLNNSNCRILPTKAYVQDMANRLL